MKWINSLTNYKSTYYIYKLNSNDSIIIFNRYYHQKKLIIILYGSLYIVKIFDNKRIIPITILAKDDVFNNTDNTNEFYYKLTALEKTYILNIELNNKEIYTQIDDKLLNNLFNSYLNTINTYQSINAVIKQKHLNRKIAHILLLLFLKFGIINNGQIHIPFKLSQKNLALIIGISEESISKTIKQIHDKWYIKSYKKQLIEIKDLFSFTLK
uniref:Global nitrogen transcriptional regulator n=1 Tax=Chondria sp. (in: red algae) TaxID=1982705 RepID=A0A1Z1MDY3_9FLOR|nr:global nitrogen transcriptional regulator [Chondria sp. (in: red algae)]